MKMMNEFSFYEELKSIILDKYENLINGRLSSFFETSENFNLALSLSYFVLSEDTLFTENKITLRMDKEKLDYLFTKEFCDNPPIIIRGSHKKESRRNLQRIRNGFLHSDFKIDFKNQLFHIDSKEKNFECKVPFEWLMKYMDYHILEEKQVKKISIRGVFVTSDIYNRKEHFDNINDIKNYIEMLYTYKIDLTSSTLMQKEEIKNFVIKQINKISASISKKKIGRRNYLEKWKKAKRELKREIYKKYPDVKVIIRVEKDLEIASKLDELYNTENNNIFQIKSTRGQCRVIIKRLKKYYSKSKDDLIKSFEDINTAIKIYNNIENDESYKENKDIINYILNFKCGKQEILEFIHKYRSKKGLTHSYDNMDIGTKDVPIFKKEKNSIRKFFNRKENLQLEEDYTIKLGKLKDYRPSIYRKYKGVFERENLPSEEDNKIYNSDLIKNTIKIKNIIQKEREKIDLAIIYTLGISTYAINKEKAFENDNLNPIDASKINSYSTDAYSEHEKTQKYLENRKNQLIRLIKKESNKNRRINLQKELKEVEFKLEQENKQKPIIFRNKIVLRCNPEQTAKIIRDYFSHLSLEKIEFSCYEEGQMELITEKGFIKCDISSLINFITQDAFSSAMKKKYSSRIKEIPIKKGKFTKSIIMKK